MAAAVPDPDLSPSPWVDTVPTAAPRRRFRDLPHWILVTYGLTQAVVTTLMVFGVITTTTLASAVTATALIAYVAANEVLAGPRWRRVRDDG
jgi:hypothetical protein